MYKHIFHITLLLLCFVSPRLTKAQHFNFIRYSVEEGLPRAGVYHMLEDNKGFIWVSTEGGGVARFDGVDWQYYNTENILLDNTVRVAFEDQSGKIWFGTENGGATVYDGKIAKHLFADSSQTAIRSIEQTPDGNIWFATLGQGIYILNPETGKVMKLTDKEGLPSNNVRIILSDNKQFLWVGTDNGLCKYDFNTFEITYVEHAIAKETIISIFQDNKNNIWFGTPKGVAKYTGKTIQEYTTQNGLIHNRVKAINQDKQGNIWLGTLKGLTKFDGTKFYNFTKKNGLSNNRIRHIMVDFAGNLWIGTYFGGVNKFNGELFKAFTEQEGLSNDQVADIELVGKQIWIATLDGINIIDNLYNDSATIETLNTTHGLMGQEINRVFLDNRKRIWVGCDKGITILNPDKKVLLQLDEQSNLISSHITAFFQENDTMFWIGTEQGVSKITLAANDKPEIKKIENFANKDGLSGNTVAGFQRDSYNRIWIGFADASITVFENGYAYNPFLSKYLNNITSITTDSRTNIWIGTKANGFFKIDPSKIEYGHLAARQYTKADGIFSNKVYSLLFDQNESLLIGYKNGVERVIFDLNDDIISTKHFEAEDGFTGIEANANAISHSHTGGIWFGSIKGAICYNPKHDITNTYPPKVYIKGLRVSFQEIDWLQMGWANQTEGWFHIPKDLVLPHNQNHISFDFVGLAFTRPKKIKYQWKLEGLDVNWSPLSYKKEMTYADLPPGQYTFKVRAANEDGFWSEPATVSFEIEAPFTKTYTFFILLFVAFVALGALILRIRLYRERRQKKQLEQQVKERTIELQHEKIKVEQQNQEIRNQTQKLEKQNLKLHELNNILNRRDRDVTDSLNYAQRIQLALLYYEQNQKQLFEKMFVLYEPKDIVSGDFYWQYENSTYKYLMVADCTGHGVPGAFMSIIGHALVQKIISQNDKVLPSEILTKLDKEINKTLHQHEEKGKDGMDIALCRIEKTTNKLVFAGAMRPFVAIVSENHKTKMLYEKGDRFGVGGEFFEDLEKKFNDHYFNLNAGDRFFLFSDGFIDQFGGKRGKKFMIKRFRDLLLQMKDVDIKNHEFKLYETFEEWKENYEQIDDILIVGVEL